MTQEKAFPVSFTTTDTLGRPYTHVAEGMDLRDYVAIKLLAEQVGQGGLACVDQSHVKEALRIADMYLKLRGAERDV